MSNVGSDALHITVNGTASDHTTTSETNTVLDIKLLDGPLYVGGHPDFEAIQVRDREAVYHLIHEVKRVACVCAVALAAGKHD